MDVGLLFRYGKVVPGREEKAIELFNEVVEFFGEKKDKGVITYFEPFFFFTSDTQEETGFFVVKGPVTEIFKLIEEEAFKTLAYKAYYLVEHFQWDLLTVGEAVMEQIERSNKVRIDLGIH
jgi:hypothetical protein